MVQIAAQKTAGHSLASGAAVSVVDLREEAFTLRQQQVLTAALELLVEGGAGLTMTAVARRASCSKETLYKWFGDRDGLLTATVQWQAAKVRVPRVDRHRLDTQKLRDSIEQFARDLLGTLAGEISVTLNRLAVTHAGEEKRGLGTIVLENGRLEMGRRLKPVLEAGRDARLLRFDSSEEAFRTFFGLVVRDVQLRLLLGDELKLSAEQVDAEARRATEQFLTLYEKH
jgi:AcrR family transcriptional regulator